MAKNIAKVGVVLFMVALIVMFRQYDGAQYLTLDYLKARQVSLGQFYFENPAQLITIYMLLYILATALSIPGATLFTLAGGAIFGFWLGLLLVSFASTIGATCAFLVSRFLLRDSIQNKFGDKLKVFNDGVKKEGAFYLFTLRLVPLFPFFLINLVMGLSPIRVATFFFVSQLGMLAGTAAYVNAGTQLAKLTSLKGILSPEILVSFIVIGLLPIISKKIIGALKDSKGRMKFKKPSHFDYNMVVIGAGSGGLVSAYIAAAVKAKVLLIEKHRMGGDCLNTGCVPSKALIKSAKLVYDAKRSKAFGIYELKPTVNFGEVMDRVKRVIAKVEPHDSRERYRGLGVECVEGTARIIDPYTVEVDGRKCTTQNIVVATGAQPLLPKIPGLDQVKHFTSDTLWELRALPSRLLILGGGPIGCELAQAFARLGSRVVQIEMGRRIMGREDADVADFITGQFAEEGIQVLTGHKAETFLVEAGEQVLICEAGGKKVRIPFDTVILALGRRANVKGFGLESLGVKLNENGTVAVNEFLQTNYPNIFACGDVAGPYQFTHTAAHQAWFAAVNALFQPFKKFRVNYSVIPWCTFTDPEVARVGLSETDAREKNIPYSVIKYDLAELDRAIAEEEDHGFVKVLTAPGKDKILGVTIVGHHAGDIIVEFITAMKYGIGLNKILGTIHIYPTLSEANKYAAGVWKKANAPQAVLRYLERFHAWRRN